MPIAFACICGTKLKADDASAGQKQKCPRCGTVVVVPGGDVKAVVDDRAPARNIFLPRSPWERAYARPITQFESRMVEAYFQIVGKLADAKVFPLEPFELAGIITAYAPINAIELPIVNFWNMTGVFDLSKNSTAGCLVTTQGIYWRNTDGAVGRRTFADLEPGDVVADPGYFSNALTIAGQAMDFQFDSDVLKAFAACLNAAIEICKEDKGYPGPTEKAIAGALAIRAKERETDLYNFVRKQFPDRKFIAVGIALWPSKHIVDPFDQIAMLSEILAEGPVELPDVIDLPDVFDVGVVGVTAVNFGLVTLIQNARDLKEIDLTAAFAEPPDELPVKWVSRRSVRSAHGIGVEMTLVFFQGMKIKTMRFPETLLRGNKQIGKQIAQCFEPISK
ncbi:MAG: hypothetical protein FJ303_18345 [Planctomycetes bacterium]|nr:hypothetical protein [Planctomycetota bacterium]